MKFNFIFLKLFIFIYIISILISDVKGWRIIPTRLREKFRRKKKPKEPFNPAAFPFKKFIYFEIFFEGVILSSGKAWTCTGDKIEKGKFQECMWSREKKHEVHEKAHRKLERKVKRAIRVDEIKVVTAKEASDKAQKELDEDEMVENSES